MKKLTVKILIIVTFLFSINIASAQTYKENIDRNFKEFGKLMTLGDLEKAFDYVHPDLFNVLPKAEMVKVTKELFNSPQFNFKFSDFTTKKFNEPIVVEGKYYVVFKYNSVIEMKFNEMEADKQPLIQMGLANKFGPDNVSFDEKTGFFKINAEKKSIAISENGKTNWKFINVEPEQRVIMEKLLPKEVREEVF